MEGKYFPSLVPHPPITPQPLNLWCKLPEIRKCIVKEQRGIYSEDIATFPSKFSAAGPEIQQRSQRSQSHSVSEFRERNTTKATTSKTPDNQRRPVDNCNHGPLSQKLYFCLGGISQKVHLPYQTLRGQIPRKLAIERRRREYLKLDFEQLLAEEGVGSDLLILRHKSDGEVTSPDEPAPPYLPLERSHGRRPLPAKALLPTAGEGAAGTMFYVYYTAWTEMDAIR
ncbi:Dynein heavy chain 1, axonemal [Liparis tanakae]|uniref:Dynein heavy chain 1, axonemal n=1 Tax=Liparis tanakae TaxID=230148 RepID=A0A4Z2FIY0_9TELE|nr:Dynein heavy chain 1, axonemal [Liparis tanakae]